MKLFFCVPYNTRLSRRSCGARHAEVRNAGEKGKLKLGAVTCVRCPIGAEHARGRAPKRWPDGSQVVELQAQPRTGEVRVVMQASGRWYDTRRA